MPRTYTIELDDEAATQIEAIAGQRNTPPSDLIAQYVIDRLGTAVSHVERPVINPMALSDVPPAPPTPGALSVHPEAEASTNPEPPAPPASQ